MQKVEAHFSAQAGAEKTVVLSDSIMVITDVMSQNVALSLPLTPSLKGLFHTPKFAGIF